MSRTKTWGKAWTLIPLFVLALAATLVCAPTAHAGDAQATEGAVLTTQASSGALTAGQIATLDAVTAGDADTSGEDPAPYEFGIGADIEKAKVTFIGGTSFAYTGKEIKPSFTATLTKDGQTRTLKGTDDPNNENADFFYFYMNNVDVSLGKKLSPDDQPVVVLATFVDGDPWVYIKEATFTIRPAKMKYTTAKIASQVYTGKRIKPAVTVKFQGKTLKRGVDYTVKYTKNIKVGKAKAIITGKGNFTGRKVAYFRIKKASIRNAKVTQVADKVFTGNRITPNIKVKYKGKVLKQGKDYTVAYKNNLNIGTATIKITGKGNMKGIRRIQFDIEPRSINDLSQAYVDSVVWTGSPLTPKPVMKLNGNKLQEGRDYSISDSNNVEPGWGRAFVTARGNYTGSRVFSFEIDKQKFDPYTGSPITARTRFNVYIYEPGSLLQPRPIVEYKGRTLIENVDYTLQWNNSNYNSYTKTGTGYVTIYGYGDHFTGTRVLSYQMIGR